MKSRASSLSHSKNASARGPAGRLIFHFFASLTQFERELIRERTLSGLSAARARGRFGGRKPKLSPQQVRVVRTLSASREHTAKACRAIRGVRFNHRADEEFEGWEMTATCGSQSQLVIVKDGFALPLELVTSTQAILARKRSGKSYNASVQAAELLEAKSQIAVIDSTGARGEERIAVITRNYAKASESTLVVSPDNRSRAEINARIHAEQQARGAVSTEEHRTRVLVPRQDLTGADRMRAARATCPEMCCSTAETSRGPASRKASTRAYCASMRRRTGLPLSSGTRPGT